MRHFVLCTLALALGISAASCSKGEYYIAAGYPPHIPLTNDTRAFVMPVWLDMSGDAAPVTLAFIGGMASECGTGCIPGQPLQPVLEAANMQGLSYRTARAMWNGAVNNVWWEGEYAAIPDLLGQFLTQVNTAMPEANFQYVVVGDVWQLGAGRIPGTVRIRLLGGLYDVQQRQVATVFWSEETMPEDTVVVNAAAMGRRIIRYATCPSGECVEAEATAAGADSFGFYQF